MNRTTRETRTSEALFERAKRVSPGGVHSPVRAFRGVGGTPRFIKEAKGAYLIDVDQNRYLDFCMSWGPLLFGHQDHDVATAVTEAMGRGWSFGTAEPYSLELAELITSRIPWVEKIRFVNSGTEAVMSALRVARAVTGRSKVVKFDGCYHGHVDSLLVRAGSGLVDLANPDSAGVSPRVAEDTIVAPLDDAEALRKVFKAHPGEIAVVAIEPLPANNGLLIQREEFIRDMVQIARENGALVLFDEVISGFRIGFGGMAERLKIQPDLVCYGKVIGGGFPVGAYGGKREYMDWVAPQGPVYQAGTLSANPVAMAAGLAMLKKLDRLKPYRALEDRVEALSREIEAVSQEEGIDVHVQRYGSLFWAVCGKVSTGDHVVRSISQIPADQKALFSRVFHALLDRGVYLAPSGFEVSFLSTAHDDMALRDFVETYREALQAVKSV